MFQELFLTAIALIISFNNDEARPKFTGSYKKKACILCAHWQSHFERLKRSILISLDFLMFVPHVSRFSNIECSFDPH